MENASKALLMAAGVLIGVLILSLAVYLFVSFGSTSSELRKQKEAQDLQKFNSQFLSYEGKEGITIYDVVSVAKLATENNKYYELDDRVRNFSEGWNDYYISVTFEGRSIENNKDDQDDLLKKLDDAMKMNDQDPADKYLVLKQYQCTVEINSVTGRVYRVKFQEKT